MPRSQEKSAQEERIMESLKIKRTRAKTIFEILDPLYGQKKTALKYRTPFQLLVATILSAQCTDKQVNRVTATLFEKYNAPQDFVEAPIGELEQCIRPTGFFRNKTRSIKGCAQRLLDVHGGTVPSTMEELVRLPGVGRKTANCVLGAAFNVPGVVVDTHVKRLAQRLGLTASEDPNKIEKDLEKLFIKGKWRRFSDLLIHHGRAVCRARKPNHTGCPIVNLCPSNTI
jgi:endonuclease-3